ncbi:MAG: RNA polymerase sporulation sigma factor SigK [Clostridia bacterium]|nr:RNA polymerase sporulation sigma factor SigK [Clostridia bacterium]
MFLDMLFKFFSKIFLFTGKLSNPNNFEKKLKPEEEKNYFSRIQDAKSKNTSDPEAEEKLIRHNLRLVAHIANKYKSNFSDADDLISIGTIGLIKAVRTFNPEKASSFSTYASRCIENEILMLFRSEKKLSGDISLESTIGVDKDGNDMSLSDILADPSIDLESQTSRKIALEKIEKLATTILDKREKFVISHRYGLFKKVPMTQKEIADRLGISRSYISRIEKIALKKIKENI